MEKVYYLKNDTSLFTNEFYYDLRVIESEKTKDISPLILKSDKITNLSDLVFELKYVLERFDNRDLMLTNKSWPVISWKFKKLIEEYIDFKYEFFQTKIKINNQINTDYCIINIPEITDIVDKEKSVYDVDEIFPDSFGIVEKLVIKMPNNFNPIFRVYEYRAIIIIRENLKKQIEKQKLKGISFIDIEKFNSYIE